MPGPAPHHQDAHAHPISFDHQEAELRNISYLEIAILRIKPVDLGYHQLQLVLFNQKPETRNQKPETRNQKPETRNQKPETRNQKPETRNQKPETSYPKTRRTLCSMRTWDIREMAGSMASSSMSKWASWRGNDVRSLTDVPTRSRAPGMCC